MSFSNGWQDEVLLIERSKEGDDSAYAELIKRYQSKIYFLCNQMLHDRELAEDITQEAFIHAYQNLSKFKMESKFYTWVYRIAVNLSINRLRKISHQKTTSLSDFNYGTEAGQAYLEKMQKSRETPEIHELHEAIEKGLQRLSPIHREVLTLFDIEGLSHQEIASKLQTNPGTIRSRLFYARKQLQKFLKDFIQ